MPDRDPARLFFELATTNPATFQAILDDAHLPIDAFVAVHHGSIRAHCIRQGYRPHAERASRAASNLWSYLQYLRSWIEPPTIDYSRHSLPHPAPADPCITAP